MKCLITGVAGFIGSNLLARLLREEWEVVGVDDLSHGFLRNVEPHLGDSKFRFVQADVRDPAVLAREAAEVQVLVHLAAGKIPRYGNSLETLETNLLGGRNVLEACRVHGARAVIASTSD